MTALVLLLRMSPWPVGLFNLVAIMVAVAVAVMVQRRWRSGVATLATLLLGFIIGGVFLPIGSVVGAVLLAGDQVLRRSVQRRSAARAA